MVKGLPDCAEDLVQQRDDAVEKAPEAAATGGRVEDARDGTEEVAEKVPGSLLCGDVEYDLVEMHDQPQQVEIERAEREVKDVARTRHL